jgi:outer membrane protein assembly factor BamB
MLRQTDRAGVVGSYEGLSRIELEFAEPKSPAFTCELRPGWNRLLLKLTTAPYEGASEMRCHLRIQDPPEVPYESKNILWMAPLPARSTSTPILVGERLIVFCEPDEVVCLDKNSGKILWTAFVNDYEALEPEAKKANPAYAETIDPLVAELRTSKDRHERLVLRAKIRSGLEKIDAGRFHQDRDGHFAAHFGIVGFTMPTPLSDGRRIYVWSGMGVAACFDLEGKRQWIASAPTKHLAYGSSPALVDGVLAVYINELFGLDAETGALKWRQPRLKTNIGAVQAAKWGGQGVFVAQRGDVIRASDGEFLYRPRGSTAVGDAGWAPPQILGNLMHLPNYGVKNLKTYDFSAVQGEKWEPKMIADYSLSDSISRGPKGEWIDRMTAGSPVVWQGISYMVDIYEVLYAVEVATGKLLYQQDLKMNGLTHYNAVAVAASPALIGKHLFIENNQGTTVVLEPGPTYKEIRRNRIATQLDRTFPIPSQETMCYAPPLADGKRLYFRGEAYLYCIGEK